MTLMISKCNCQMHDLFVALIKIKLLRSWVKSKGIETQFELAGGFELLGFYCIIVIINNNINKSNTAVIMSIKNCNVQVYKC